jgi:alpha-mannosidase
MRNRNCLILIFLLVAGFSGQAESGNPKMKEVIVVFKTHFDIGYTDWAANVRYNYSHSMIEGALDVIDQSKQMPKDQQFKWIVAGWPMKEMLENSKPEVKLRIQKAIQDGNFVVHALPFTFETEACELESMVRSLCYSSKINHEAGLPLPIDAKQTDVPSHSWILPTILANSGIKFLHIGCNSASRSPELPLLFWWEGPDKSRLMTMYFGPYYGTSPTPPEDWPFKTWLAIIHTNDNTGAPTFDEFKKAIREIEEKNPDAKVRTGNMADFYNAIMAENPQLPVIRGDMPDTWIHGYMSMPREVKTARRLGSDIFNLEALNTLSKFRGAKTDKSITQVTDQALEDIHLFNEHTFGLAMSHGHSGYWAYGNNFETLRALGLYEPIEFSWREKAQHITEAEQLVAPVFSRKLKKLAESVRVEGERIVVYNPLPWERSGMVTVQTNTDLKKALKNLQTNEIIRFSKVNNVYRFNVNRVPSMGYTTLIPVDEPVDQINKMLEFDTQNTRIENEFFRITLDPASGTIKSLFDKKNGKEMVSNSSEWKFGQYVNERFSKNMTDQYAKDYIKGGWDWAYAELGRINLSEEPYHRNSGSKPQIDLVKDEVSVSASVHFDAVMPFGHKYSVIFILYRDQPYVEMVWSINGKPADSWPEAGWISFPFNIDNPQFKLGRPGAIVNPVTDYVKGSNLDYCFLNTGMAILDEKNQGIGITSPDVPAISLDRPGLWKYSTSFIPQKPNVFFNLYNNQWSTNFTEWVEGSWSTRFYIWSIDRYENAPSIVTPSEEIRNPLMSGLATGKPGNLSVSEQGISLSEKGILVTAFGKNQDGEGDLICLWEQNGRSVKLTVTFPSGMKYTTATPVNLRGEKLAEPVKIANDKLSFTLKAYAPASFILRE